MNTCIYIYIYIHNIACVSFLSIMFIGKVQYPIYPLLDHMFHLWALWLMMVTVVPGSSMPSAQTDGLKR